MKSIEIHERWPCVVDLDPVRRFAILVIDDTVVARHEFRNDDISGGRPGVKEC
ncbi:hypothetical protein OAK95_02585 [Akkermansiaceae bacterium]|nr:hypothetical protein [Akkermansiaceae bacterium]